ncbi:hypothetical protein [Ferrimonas gelatinilytica]
MERRFYRLNEISQVSALSEGDLLDLVERDVVSLCARVEGTEFAAMLKAKDGEYGLGNLFHYRGMISLPNSVSVKLINDEKASLTRALILEPEGVSQWRSNQALAQEHPKMSFSYCGNLSVLPQNPFWAFTCVQALPDMHSIMKGFETMTAALADQTVDRLDAFKAMTQKHLSTAALNIKPHQLRFELESIKAHLRHNSVTTKPFVAPTETLTHPIKQILARMLTTQPHLRSDRLWNMLRTEVNQDGPREYDVDSVISNMTHDDLSWFGRDRNKENTVSYGRFQNLVSEVRKALKT